MHIDEINKQSWQVPKSVVKTASEKKWLNTPEKILVIEMMGDSKDKAYVSCSLQDMITVFSKSVFFLLNEVVFSKETGFVIQVKGVLKGSALTIRKQERKLSRETKTKLRRILVEARKQKDANKEQ